jgi:HEAT repeat protein
VLRNLAKGSSTPELQSKAIQYLGVHGGRDSRAVLADVYASTSDVDVKRRIQSEQNLELRAEAVRQLGAMSAHDELWQLYQKEPSVDVKKQILNAMFVGGNAARLIELARTERDPELRRTAVKNLGVMGARQTGDALVQIYGSEQDPAIRRAVINGLFVQGNAAALVALARKEQDIELKKDIVARLSNMRDKVAVEYLLEILNK